MFKDWGPNDTVNYLGLPDSLVSLPEDSKVRSWIVERLKADPNFFMPHLCWVKLGFPGEVESCEEIEATPPSMDALLCYPSFEEKIVRLTEILEAAIAKQERNELFGKLKPEERFKEGREWSEVQEAYDTLHERILNFDLDPEFYECWRVVKEYVKSNIYRGVICDVYQIFDSAYEKYILNERKPAVDLAKLFADLAHSRCDHSGVIERIQKSYYEIEPGKKERYDPLYTEREKEVFGLKGAV